MSTLAAAADDYLRVRRALGYKLDRQGRQLLQFIAYLDAGRRDDGHDRACDRLGDPAGRRDRRLLE